PNDGGVTEFMGDYFKLVFGQENADIIMKQIEKDSNAGHIYSRNPTEYKAGAFMLKYDKLETAMSIEIKLP
ncbi:MAG: hypothetical protein JXO44_03410, partial [Clostridia bacterium]|nr:hypothetical protein [Clostridia bacterium]